MLEKVPVEEIKVFVYGIVVVFNETESEIV